MLITGACGFIGRKTALYFLENGYDVIGWNRTKRNTVFPIINPDMKDCRAIERELEKIQPDIIIHCAGSADVGKSVANPEMDYEGNVTLTHNLLFAIRKSGLEKKRFVFLSSAGVYGNPVSLPITEDMPLNPLSPYAVHKVMCEELCKYFINNYCADIKIARIFSAYGAGLKKQIFWDMYKKTVNTGRLDMFGTGNESRDYIHANDVVNSLYLLATAKTNEIVFNVANGEEITIRQVTKCFASVLGIAKENISFNGVAREGDPINWRADISRIKVLGYHKTVRMADGIREYVKWCNEYKKI